MICNHAGDSTGTHAFEWPSGKRNVWNPYEPICAKCGMSIGDCIAERDDLLAAVRQAVEAAQRCRAFGDSGIETSPDPQSVYQFGVMRGEAQRILALLERRV